MRPAIFIIMLAGMAAAMPGVPHHFYGEVMINGAAAPDGTAVSARLGDSVVSSITTNSGTYGYSGNIFYVDDADDDRRNKTIRFFVNGIDTGETRVFSNGASSRADLAVTIPASPPAQSTGSSSGGGGSAGSGANILNRTENTAGVADDPEPSNTATTAEEGTDVPEEIPEEQPVTPASPTGFAVTESSLVTGGIAIALGTVYVWLRAARRSRQEETPAPGS